jgi:uncharacterized membrane protein YcgQ (UPF0703/DUF1980 family)
MYRTMTLMAVSTWALVPTGTPDDVIVLYIINKLGPAVYAAILITLLLLMVHFKITPKKLFDTATHFFKKVFA